MDEKKEITHIIANLRDELDYAKAELSRLNFKDEAAEEYGKAHDPNAADEAQRPQQPQNRHSGVAMLPIHYTLGQHHLRKNWRGHRLQHHVEPIRLRPPQRDRRQRRHHRAGDRRDGLS